jgi:hypothetical protein
MNEAYQVIMIARQNGISSKTQPESKSKSDYNGSEHQRTNISKYEHKSKDDLNDLIARAKRGCSNIFVSEHNSGVKINSSDNVFLLFENVFADYFDDMQNKYRVSKEDFLEMYLSKLWMGSKKLISSGQIRSDFFSNHWELIGRTILRSSNPDIVWELKKDGYSGYEIGYGIRYLEWRMHSLSRHTEEYFEIRHKLYDVLSYYQSCLSNNRASNSKNSFSGYSSSSSQKCLEDSKNTGFLESSNVGRYLNDKLRG